MARTAGGADDAASPGPMSRAGGGGRHDRPFDETEYLCPRGDGQSNRRPEKPLWIKVHCRGRRPRGCRAQMLRTRSSPNASSTSARRMVPATMVGARSGCNPGTLTPLLQRNRGQPSAKLREPLGRHHAPLHPRRIVGLHAGVDRRDRGRRAGHRHRSRRPARARRPAPPPRRSRARRRRAPASPPPPAGPSGGGAPCGGRRPACVETWKSTSPRSPTTSSVEPPPMSTTSSGRPSASSRAAVAPRNVSRASSSPDSVRPSSP